MQMMKSQLTHPETSTTNGRTGRPNNIPAIHVTVATNRAGLK